MDNCIVFNSENDATEQFIYDVKHNKEHILKFNKANKNILDDKGITHWYMGESRYWNWCRGREYIMNGMLYRGGYHIDLLGRER